MPSATSPARTSATASASSSPMAICRWAAAVGTKLEIEYFGKRYGATVADDPVFDAKMTRLKS